MSFQFLHDLGKQIGQIWQQNVSSRLLPLLGAIRIGGLIVAAVSLCGFALITEVVLHKQTDNLDTAFLLSLRKLHAPVLDRTMVAITYLGQPDVLLVICIVAGIGLLILNRRSQAMTLAIAGLGAIGLNHLLKGLFARTRPSLWDRILDVSSYSFPSGHAMISLVVYGAIGYLLASQFQRRSGLIFTLTFLLICAIGLSRLYLGVHWPTDVVAGYAAGLVWLTACILSLEVWLSRSIKN